MMIAAIIFGIFFGVLCGFTVWLLDDIDRVSIKNSTQYFWAVTFGLMGSVLGGALVREKGIIGICVSLLLWFVCSIVGGCASRF